GFMAGLLLIAVYAGAAALNAFASKDSAARRRAIAFGVVLFATAAATLVNPNGARLHADIIHHLGMKTTASFQEFHSPDFQSPSYPIFFFEVLALGAFVAAALSSRRLALVEVVLLVVFLHEALHSVRHMNLFAIVAAPIIARELTAPLERRRPAFHARWRDLVAEQAALKAPFLYLPALSVLLVVLSVRGALGFPTTFDGIRLSRGAIDFIAAHRDRFARPFNTDNLGGPLIYRFWPDV